MLLLHFVVFLSIVEFGISKDLFYAFEVSYFAGSPDGVLKMDILGVNRQFPGPMIRGNVGDILNVKVTNRIQDGSNTTMHWHGLLLYNNPFQDGPSQITQCPLPNGRSQLYSFPLQQAGTFWWHSHTTYQYTEGLWGPMIIDDPQEPYASDYDDELIITLNDWYHTSGKVNTAWYMSKESQGNIPIPDSFLINGRGKYTCKFGELKGFRCNPFDQAPATFDVIRGKRYRVRLINTSAMSSFNFTIDGHPMTIIEVDGVRTVKVETDIISISPAQRYSFIVNMAGYSSNYYIRAKAHSDMYDEGANINKFPEALISEAIAVLKYDCNYQQGCNPNDYYDKGAYSPTMRYLNEYFLRPYDKVLAPYNYNQQIVYNVQFVQDKDQVWHGTFNGTIYKVGNSPALAQMMNRQLVPWTLNPVEVGFNKVIQIVVNNFDSGAHPFHLHGHVFYVMGKGDEKAGIFDPKRDVLYRDGVKRDTVIVKATSWLVIRFISDNPGAWVFHCHINWHVQSGLASLIVEGANELRRTLTIPDEAKRVCSYSNIRI